MVMERTQGCRKLVCILCPPYFILPMLLLSSCYIYLTSIFPFSMMFHFTGLVKTCVHTATYRLPSLVWDTVHDLHHSLPGSSIPLRLLFSLAEISGKIFRKYSQGNVTDWTVNKMLLDIWLWYDFVNTDCSETTLRIDILVIRRWRTFSPQF